MSNYEKEIGILLVAACALLYSYFINPRLLEDSTHPLWNRILTDLCYNHRSRLWVTPQWRLYISPRDGTYSVLDGLDTDSQDSGDEDVTDEDGNDDDEHNVSGITTADSDAVQVISDFAILLPIFKTFATSPLRKLTDVLNGTIPITEISWNPCEWFLHMNTVSVSHLYAPLLLELKRPITRRAPDIVAYARVIATHLAAAQAQVLEQALCLFSSPKYATQTKVILLAGAAEWWSFQMMSREGIVKLLGDKFQYELYRSKIAVHAAKLQQLERDMLMDEDVGEKPMRVKDMEKASAAIAEKEAMEVAKRIELQNRQREDRARKRAQRDFEVLVDTAQGPVYSDHNLRQLSMFLEQGVFWEDDPHYKTVHLFKMPADGSNLPSLETYSDGNWSPMMRLGTKASNKYMKDIKDLLAASARNETM